MTDKIINALKQLDVQNDNHWTTNGDARLETVRMLAADQSISREAIETAQPGFNRKNHEITGQNAEGQIEQGSEPATPNADGSVTIPGARDITADGGLAGVDANGDLSGRTDQEAVDLGERIVGEQPETGDLSTGTPEPAPGQTNAPTEQTPANGQDPSGHPAPATSGNAAPEGGTTSPREDAAAGAPQASSGGDPTAQETEQDEMESDDEDDIAELEADLEEAEAYVARLNEYKDQFDVEYAKAMKAVDDARDKVTTARGDNVKGGEIAAYLEAQKNRLEERAQRREAVNLSGLNVKELMKSIGKSPIDAAMARKTGRGGTRPTRV